MVVRAVPLTLCVLLLSTSAAADLVRQCCGLQMWMWRAARQRH